MDKTKVVSLPLRAGPGVVYFKIGSKKFPLQFGYSSEQIEHTPAKVLPFGRSKHPLTQPLTTTAAELDARAKNHHVPDDAILVWHTPAYFPAVD